MTDINSPAFRRWFDGSKVVDKNGDPLVLWHATKSSRDFATFDMTRMRCVGAHFGSRRAAEQIVSPSNFDANDPKHSARVQPYYLRVVNPLGPVEDDTDWVLLRKRVGPPPKGPDPRFWALFEESRSTPEGPRKRQLEKTLVAMMQEQRESQSNQRYTYRSPLLDEMLKLGSITQATYDEDMAQLKDIFAKSEQRKRRGGDSEAIETMANRQGGAIIRARMQEAGHDGFFYVNNLEDRGHTSWCVISSNQIKSANRNRGTFDLDDPNVRRNPRRW